MSNKEWFTDWFDSRYYHILYQNRNEKEARIFIDNLITFLSLAKHSHIVDLCCGKGRHSVSLNKKGFRVTGLDIAPSSIDYANQFTNDTLRFKVQDMRLPFDLKCDAVFNLFTSFGYFKEKYTDAKVMQNISDSLEKDGKFIIDYMNVEKVIAHLIPSEHKTLSGVDFSIKRRVREGFIEKEISFENKGKQQTHTEQVKCLYLNDFSTLFKNADLELLHCFGNYQLDDFDAQKSDRCIIIAKKK